MSLRTTLATFAAVITVASAAIPTAQAVIYTVNTTSDTIVAGACAGNQANCSLRGAMTAANASAGADQITISLPAGSVINLTGALPDITEGVIISGPGADQVTVRRSTGGNYKIFHIVTGPVVLNGITISNGRMINDQGALSLGGGIRNDGQGLSITNCAIIGNFSARGGGGICNAAPGVLTISNSTLSGNSASRQGGGAIENLGTASITNCTISGNSAFIGGGIRNFGGTVNLTNSTVAGNAASDVDTTGGGGLLNDTGGTFNIKSSLVAGNQNEIGTDISGTFASAGFNFIGSADGGTVNAVATDQKGNTATPLDPKLDPDGLKRNGGPTMTIALMTGSPAIDKGTAAGLTGNLTTDQRGNVRPVDNAAIANAAGGDGSDIGAFELGAVAATGAVSRKSHNGTPFDIDLANIEPRSGGGNGDYTLVVTFPSSVTVTGTPQAQVTSGGGQIGSNGSTNGGAVTVNGNMVTVPITNAGNAQTLMITLFGVSDGTTTSNVSVPIKLLLGDTNNDGFVNSGDIAQTKSKSGQTVDATNFRTDVTVDGAINSADISLVKSKSGTALP